MLVAPETLDFSLPDARTIAPPPRADEALQRSIQARGILQAVLVRPRNGGHQIVCGRRRTWAAIKLGIPQIEADCREMTDLEAIQAQVIENLQREALHPVDQWKATKLLLDAGATAEDAAMALGLDARAAQRMALLATLHPDIEALILTDMPSLPALGAIAAAPPDQQAAALKVPYAAPDGQPNWVVIANACRQSAIPRAYATFDVDTAGIVFEEDLFAEPGAPDQFVTHDTAGFLAAQTAALQTRVQAGRAGGERVQLADWHMGGIKLPPGWTRLWIDPPKRPPTGDTGPVILVAISRAPRNFGEVVEALADPPHGAVLAPARGPAPAPAGAPAQRAAAARTGSPSRHIAPQATRGTEAPAGGSTEPAPHHGPALDPQSLSAKGRSIIAEAKTAALREHLRHPPGAHEGLSLLTRCLLLALAGDNVEVRDSKYQSVDFDVLITLLVGRDGRLIEHSDATLLDLLGETLAKMLVISDPTAEFGSGPVAEYIAHALEVPAPRLDTAEFLATLHGDELRKISHAHTPNRSMPTTVVALRNSLVGRLPNWRPAAFGAPGPLPKPAPRRAPAKPARGSAS